MLSVINKLSTLTAPSMIDFFFTNINLSNMTKLTLLDSLLQEVTVTEIQIATCLIRPSLHCLIHFSKRCVSCRSPVLSSLRLGRQGTQLEHPTHTNSPKLKMKKSRVDQKTKMISLYERTPKLFSD